MQYDEDSKYYSYSDEDHDLWMLLTHTRYAIYRSREKELHRYGVSPEQVGVLFIVQALDNKATPSEISRFILRQPHTVSALIERMAEKGFVKKMHDLERKNLVRVSLTEKGKKVYEYSTKRGPIHRIMSALTAEERTHLRKLLQKLHTQARKEIGLDREKFPPEEE
ncbi:MAG TPA: MarR family transcriptional regulator [Dehalococcoidales bacterium]|nr:MarR family transcriptional regulator [Dehalococcoidales bacterium]